MCGLVAVSEWTTHEITGSPVVPSMAIKPTLTAGRGRQRNEHLSPTHIGGRITRG